MKTETLSLGHLTLFATGSPAGIYEVSILLRERPVATFPATPSEWQSLLAIVDTKAAQDKELGRLLAKFARAQAAAYVYAQRVDALGLAADDNDPAVMASAGPIGDAQAVLWAALDLLELDASGEVVAKPPTESLEQLRAERDSARMLAEVRGKEIERLNAEVVKAKDIEEAARWVAKRIDPPGDWACAECKPYSDMLHINPGFRCAIHRLRAAFAEEPRAPGDGYCPCGERLDKTHQHGDV